MGRKISGFRLRVNVEVIQYVVLGPRLKVVNLNILPESLRYELKYGLKIPFIVPLHNPEVSSSRHKHFA